MRCSIAARRESASAMQAPGYGDGCGVAAGGARELFSLLDMVIAGASCGTQEAIGAMTDNAASGDEEESNGTIR